MDLAIVKSGEIAILGIIGSVCGIPPPGSCSVVSTKLQTEFPSSLVRRTPSSFWRAKPSISNGQIHIEARPDAHLEAADWVKVRFQSQTGRKLALTSDYLSNRLRRPSRCAYP